MFSFPDTRKVHNRLWWIGKTRKMAGTSGNSFNGSYRVQRGRSEKIFSRCQATVGKCFSQCPEKLKPAEQFQGIIFSVTDPRLQLEEMEPVRGQKDRKLKKTFSAESCAMTDAPWYEYQASFSGKLLAESRSIHIDFTTYADWLALSSPESLKAFRRLSITRSHLMFSWCCQTISPQLPWRLLVNNFLWMKEQKTSALCRSNLDWFRKSGSSDEVSFHILINKMIRAEKWDCSALGWNLSRLTRQRTRGK